jgi:hypothetical protein
MKLIRKLILPILAVLFGIYTCEKEKTSTGLQSGKLDKISDCKELKSIAIWEDTADTLSCIEYFYNAENKKLILKHVNAGFNCCPEKIYSDITFADDSIIIIESEKIPACDCNCLYDLEFEFTGISEKVYAVRLLEPYIRDEEEINVSIDLAENDTGSFCVIRKGYPWGLHY